MGNLQQCAERRIVAVVLDELVRDVPANTEPALNIGAARGTRLDTRLTIRKERDDTSESRFPRGFARERWRRQRSLFLCAGHVSVILANYTMVIQRGYPRGLSDLLGASEEGFK